MSYPDFSPQGYQVITELGRNREGGRITWLTSNVNTSQQVVVKQFCFAQLGSNWSAFTAHEREIQVLQGLNHPGIPKYLGAFETPDGFCLIQEYKNAPTLGLRRSFDAEEIKQIAVKALSILVYLQNRIPPIIHRDIKPENILVDDQFNVYLIDFGMSRVGSEEVSGSSVFKGTLGFIPPEQMRQPTIASDLYGLGTTLICLLTGTPSGQIQKLTDDDDPHIINFRHLLPQLNLRFLNWLELMVKPKLKDRFVNAQTALEALKPLDVVRFPEVELSQSMLEFTATRLGEKLRQTITIENPIPDTVLQGKWEVAPHPQDPPHTPDSHPWISVEPANFSSNHTACRVQVDTSQLMADKLYKRQLLLLTNAYPEVHHLTLEIETAALPIQRQKVPYAGLSVWLLSCVMASIAITLSMTADGFGTGVKVGLVGAWVGFGLGFLVGVESAFEAVLRGKGGFLDVLLGLLVGAVMVGGIGAGVGFLIGIVAAGGFVAVVTAIVGFVAVVVALVAAVAVVADVENKFTAIFLLLLTAGLGTSIRIGCMIGLFNSYILLALAGTGLPLATILLYPRLQRRKLITKYRQSEERLIKP
ncbi:serine/threonine protein kinase [Nostoc sp.]|uniref:serine/threonine protein kinase n=1 Tax=Nostoc sp. TaxID=1180 RepID=UPI002FFBEBFB